MFWKQYKTRWIIRPIWYRIIQYGWQFVEYIRFDVISHKSVYNIQWHDWNNQNFFFVLCMSADVDDPNEIGYNNIIRLCGVSSKTIEFQGRYSAYNGNRNIIAKKLRSILPVVGYTISQWFIWLLSNNIRTQYTLRICNEIIDCCLFRDYIKTGLTITVQNFSNCIRGFFFIAIGLE